MFNRMVERHIDSWNFVIVECVRSGNIDEVVQLLH